MNSAKIFTIDLIFNHDKEWNIDPNNNSNTDNSDNDNDSNIEILAIIQIVQAIQAIFLMHRQIWTKYKLQVQARSIILNIFLSYWCIIFDITMDSSFTFMFFHGDGVIDMTSFSSSPLTTEIFILNRVQRKIKNHPETGELSQYYANF
ncbi:LOW QUALITY PROTEIN: hypothetical protein V1477_004511 [Vespula maculifrons]|uniref:Uncharacterized protein n=1 Tax=Vespula maculifrons TaxID=7453 RepID=A0ABD2CM16_VESMC